MTNSANKYAEFITNQLIKEGVVSISESLAKATEAIEKIDPDAIHLGSHGTQHAFAHGETDRGEAHYYTVHDTATNKNHDIALEHGGKAMTMAHIKKVAGKEVHPNLLKMIHNDHKEELSAYED